LLGRADDAKFDAEMVVPEVALIGRTIKRADCDQENIIIIPERWMLLFSGVRPRTIET
jgi:hypothetical protein